MLRQRKCLLADVIEVIGEASDVTIAEAENAGLTPWTLTKAIWEARKNGDSVTIFDGENPLFCIGHYPDPLRPKTRALWMIAKQEWFARGAPSILYGRRFMKALCARFPGSRFESTSWSRHPDLIRWFQLQGFTHIGYSHGATVFEIAKKG